MTDAAGGAHDVLGQLMLAFDGGESIPDWLDARLDDGPPAGFTLFRFLNVQSPGQVRTLTDALQARAPEALPYLIAVDQEGGQFQALGEGPTQFPGAMALGATGDPALAERVGRAIGLELAAMGVNVCYAPVADVVATRENPALGIRGFGSDAEAVAGFVGATVRGLRSAGVAATAKHFPGAGSVATDTHHARGIVDHDRDRLDAVELAPFRAAVHEGVQLIMSGHFAVPALTGGADVPATLSGEVMSQLLRFELGFGGVTITDALDMKALDQGPNQVLDVLAALRAGVDLLLLALDPVGRERVTSGLRHAAGRRLIDADGVRRSLKRIEALRRSLAPLLDERRPGLNVVGCEEHRALSREVAERSLTLIRDEDGILPLRLKAGDRILALMPQPQNLTPADTSSTVEPALAAALRKVHPDVHELVVEFEPTDEEIATARRCAADSAAVVVGTIAAEPGSRQARLVEALLSTGRPVVTAALRTPWDLQAYPAARTHLCTYSVLPSPLEALASALLGRLGPSGTLPVPLER
jgi:beta-N-acetylhexosaminidase